MLDGDLVSWTSHRHRADVHLLVEDPVGGAPRLLAEAMAFSAERPSPSGATSVVSDRGTCIGSGVSDVTVPMTVSR